MKSEFFKKMSITTKMPLNWYSLMKFFFSKDSDNFWHRKLTLKLRNQDFSIATCQRYVDLPKFCYYDKVPFSTQLSYHLMWKLLKKSWMVSNSQWCLKAIMQNYHIAGSFLISCPGHNRFTDLIKMLKNHQIFTCYKFFS